MPLHSGDYHLFSSTTAGPIRPDRPLGASDHSEGPNRQVVAIPIVGPLPTWRVQQIGENAFTLSLGGRNATIFAGSLVLTDLRLAPFPWDIDNVNTAPPIGNVFKITALVERPPVSWFVPNNEGNPGVEVPVTIAKDGSAIFFIPAFQD